MSEPTDLSLIEASALETWRRDATLRDEFDGDESSYLAYRRAEAMGLVKLCAPSARPPSASPAAPRPTATAVDPTLPLEDRCRAQWRHDPELRAQFGCLEEYIAYSKANADHLVHVREGAVRGR